jgi:hypothetical protein
VSDTNRRYERIDIELPVRLFIPGEGGLKFEAFCTSSNLGLGGLFVASSFLLPEGLEVVAELGLPSGALPIRSKVAHVVALDQGDLASGMGVEFLDVDAHGRETLLRYFTPIRYGEFYRAFVAEFPHLKKDLPLPDVSLMLNLWEEWKVKQEGGPSATSSGVQMSPPVRRADAPARPPARPPPSAAARPAPRRPRRR